MLKSLQLERRLIYSSLPVVKRGMAEKQLLGFLIFKKAEKLSYLYNFPHYVFYSEYLDQNLTSISLIHTRYKTQTIQTNSKHLYTGL